MNNTKWNEIFNAFYDLECSNNANLSKILIPWTTKSTNGYIYSDATWTHFGSENYKDIEWLKIDLTPENKEIVLNILHKIHVPGEVKENEVIVYGYRTDIDYI